MKAQQDFEQTRPHGNSVAENFLRYLVVDYCKQA